MRSPQSMSASVVRGIGLAAALVVAGALVQVVHAHGGARVASQGSALEATVFSYDGHDFVRTKTTMMTQDGKSAANTKLDQSSPAYKALVKKHSFSGEVTVFGKKYDAYYAPLTGDDGKLTGALFVGTPK